MTEKLPLSHEVVCFQMLDFGTSNSKAELSKSNSWKTTSFSKTTLLQEPFLTIVLYYQPLPITHYQMRYYANNFLEQLPTVSTDFKEYLIYLFVLNDW